LPIDAQWRNNGVGRVGKVQGAPSVRGPEFQAKQIITVKYRHNYSHHRMFRCSIAAANTDKLQFKFKFYSYVMWNCVDDKKDNEEGRAPLEYLPRGPRVSSYATVDATSTKPLVKMQISVYVAVTSKSHNTESESGG